VAALGYRAREGLRQAYLQIHLAETARRGCRPALDKLAAYVRGGVARRESAQVERHLAGCTDCQASYAELADLKTGLRTVVGPLILGTAATAYFTGSPATALGGRFGAWRQVPRRRLQTFGAGAATIGAMAALGLVLAAQEEPDKEVRPGRPPATAPAVPVPGQSEATKP
jgi:anti-sigma factor RsiW